jgi:hypothetical protein
MALTVIKPSGGGTGIEWPAAVAPMQVNSNTITYDITIAGGTNALSAGPIGIANGVTVTVATGARWVVV